MKYIKKFEQTNTLSESEREYHLNEIHDLFLDCIDEYNIEELPDDMDEDDDSKPGIYYYISDFSEIADKFRRENGVLRRCQFELSLYCTSPYYLDFYVGDPNWTKADADEGNKIWRKYFKLISEDIDTYANRLRQAGYFVKYEKPLVEELVDDSEFNIFISLEKFS